MKKRVWAPIVICVAISVATAAIRMGAPNNVPFAAHDKTLALDTDLPPLIAGHAISVARAFGGDDEDCIAVTRAAMRPNRSMHQTRKIICEE